MMCKKLKIGISVETIINSPVDEFNKLCEDHRLSKKQLNLVRDIRRRGKNKVSYLYVVILHYNAANCDYSKSYLNLDIIILLPYSVQFYTKQLLQYILLAGGQCLTYSSINSPVTPLENSPHGDCFYFPAYGSHDRI